MVFLRAAANVPDGSLMGFVLAPAPLEGRVPPRSCGQGLPTPNLALPPKPGSPRLLNLGDLGGI